MEAMEKINVTQLDGHNHTFKEHLQYLKAQDKKVKFEQKFGDYSFKPNTTICHAFITYHRFMPPLIALLESFVMRRK
jgi:hypothetical protein